MPSRGFFSRAVHSSSSVKPGPASLPLTHNPHPLYPPPASPVKNGWWGVPPWLQRGSKGLPRHSSGPIPQMAPSGPSSFPSTLPGTLPLPSTLPGSFGVEHPSTFTSTLPGRTSHHPYYLHHQHPQQHQLHQQHRYSKHQLKVEYKHQPKVEIKHGHKADLAQKNAPLTPQHHAGSSRPPSIIGSRPRTPHDLPNLSNGSSSGPQSLPSAWPAMHDLRDPQQITPSPPSHHVPAPSSNLEQKRGVEEKRREAKDQRGVELSQLVSPHTIMLPLVELGVS